MPSLSSPGRRSSVILVAWLAAAAGCAKKEAAPPVQVGPNHVFVTASDFAFTAPDSITAGLEMFHLANKGPSIHHVQVVELLQGKTIGDLTAATGLAPGAHQVISLTLTPGTYGLLCFIPDARDGKAHALHGMVKQITVS